MKRDPLLPPSQRLESRRRGLSTEQPSVCVTRTRTLLLVRVVNCGRFQYGLSAFFCIVEPQAPRLVTA